MLLIPKTRRILTEIDDFWLEENVPLSKSNGNYPVRIFALSGPPFLRSRDAVTYSCEPLPAWVFVAPVTGAMLERAKYSVIRSPITSAAALLRLPAR